MLYFSYFIGNLISNIPYSFAVKLVECILGLVSLSIGVTI